VDDGEAVYMWMMARVRLFSGVTWFQIHERKFVVEILMSKFGCGWKSRLELEENDVERKELFLLVNSVIRGTLNG
jgi:hypothetical protein